MTDEVVTNFEKRRDAGELFSNPATSYKVDIAAVIPRVGAIVRREQPLGVVKGYTNYGFNNYVGDWRPNSSDWAAGRLHSNHLWFINAYREEVMPQMDVAMTELSSKMATGIASILVSFAERDKTKGMILKALDYLRRPLKDVMRECKKMSGRDKVAKVEEWWLEGRYGWRPFIYDVISVVEAQNAEARYRLTKKDVLGFNEYEEVAWRSDYGIGMAKTRIYSRKRINQYVKYGQTGDFRAGIMAPFRKFGWYDLVGAGWDLVPYSFVIDWFVNVGEAAKAMEAFLLFEERVGWITFVEETSVFDFHQTLWDPYYSSGSWYIVDSIVGPQEWLAAKATTWTRTPYTNFMPHFGARCDLDWKKVVDIAFLLDQLWRKLKLGR